MATLCSCTVKHIDPTVKKPKSLSWNFSGNSIRNNLGKDDYVLP